ncbi:MAG: hypothetical protein C4547_02430 [Phycisphaerales bacterium]|nr:MAG: hypothetical protein C4547_02430 [Phycisphaerales bacterium]
MAVETQACRWITLHEALAVFALNPSGHQGQGHIRPLHHYVASRLVVEGGFEPDEITPRPPFRVVTQGGKRLLNYDPATGGTGERTVLGGLRTKAIDVVVTKEGVRPVLAVSMKGSLSAFRNLTNRMEEAIGDCTNVHIAYPALVYGFFHVLRASKVGAGVRASDACVLADGAIAEPITRYHDVLTRLEDRIDLRNEVTKYEAVSLILVNPEPPAPGSLHPGFPPAESALALSRFFPSMYRAYDLRFVYPAPSIASLTRRQVWDEASPAFVDAPVLDYAPRVGPT